MVCEVGADADGFSPGGQDVDRIDRGEDGGNVVQVLPVKALVYLEDQVGGVGGALGGEVDHDKAVATVICAECFDFGDGPVGGFPVCVAGVQTNNDERICASGAEEEALVFVIRFGGVDGDHVLTVGLVSIMKWV